MQVKIHHSIEAAKIDDHTVATIGTFDGVHNGHLEIIRRITDAARDSNCKSLILTFFPHPRMVIGSGGDIKLLNTLEERIDLLRRTGLDHLVVHPFDEAFSSLGAEEFVADILVEKLRAKKIIVGHDHRFGRGRSAGYEDLEALGSRYGFEVEQISAEKIDSVSVSSTKIRHALSEGDIPLANKYLGYPYMLSGTVIKGRQLGRTLGFPTANLNIAETYKLIPRQGVYFVCSEIHDKTFYGVMNIGTRPTVSGDGTSIEVYFLDLDEDLYGQKLTVNLLERLRAEQKFESTDALRQQIAQDVETARTMASRL